MRTRGLDLPPQGFQGDGLIALLLLAGVLVVMWIAQSALLASAGLPMRWRIDSREAPPKVRSGGRIITPLLMFTVIIVHPLLRGEAPLDYCRTLFPPGRPAIGFVHGAAAAVLCLALLFLAWIATGRVQVLLHHSRRKCVRRLVMLVPTALFGAGVEELLFRGVLMADLLRAPWLSTPIAVGLSALIFALAHYVRTVKRRWTFPGHVALGLLLCIAYLGTGNLWLPAGLHAGGIAMIMGTRPFFRYRGPAWLTGASIFPFAGVIGIVGLLLLTGFVAIKHGHG